MSSFNKSEVEIFLEHVRCFDTRQTVPLRPLTILVGENSSGKSTFLAMVAAMWPSDYRFPLNPQFNHPPYNLGTFETIATKKSKQNGQAEFFRVGYSVGRRFSVDAEYVNRHGQPGLKSVAIQNSQISARVSLNERNSVVQLCPLENESNAVTFELDQLNLSSATTEWARYASLSGMIFEALTSDERLKRFKAYFPKKLSLNLPFFGSVSLAPIRSRPERTYDVVNEAYDAEGGHIPALLARLLDRESRSGNAKMVANALARFGEESGMFSKVEVKRLGRTEFDPFQLQILNQGARTNLIDVGYGISQVLPIIVQSCLSERTKTILIQQPEVHLHPRAQAALGSFFVDLVSQSETGKMILVETHSDYLLDRIRREIAEERIAAEDVQILFFDKSKRDTTIYPIELDALGNVIDAPLAYRNFFLEEQERLLSRGD